MAAPGLLVCGPGHPRREALRAAKGAGALHGLGRRGGAVGLRTRVPRRLVPLRLLRLRDVRKGRRLLRGLPQRLGDPLGALRRPRGAAGRRCAAGRGRVVSVEPATNSAPLRSRRIRSLRLRVPRRHHLGRRGHRDWRRGAHGAAARVARHGRADARAGACGLCVVARQGEMTRSHVRRRSFCRALLRQVARVASPSLPVILQAVYRAVALIQLQARLVMAREGPEHWPDACFLAVCRASFCRLHAQADIRFRLRRVSVA